MGNARKRRRRMTPDQQRRHNEGIKRLDAAFGVTAARASREQSAGRKLSILEALGFGARPKRGAG